MRVTKESEQEAAALQMVGLRIPAGLTKLGVQELGSRPDSNC